MTRRVSCPPAPGLLESYAAQFDDRLASVAQRVRTDRAIRRHWALVCGAFSFCWWAWSRAPDALPRPTEMTAATRPVPVANAGRGENVVGDRPPRRPAERGVAGGAPAGAGLAPALDPAPVPVARLVHAAATPAAPGAP